MSEPHLTRAQCDVFLSRLAQSTDVAARVEMAQAICDLAWSEPPELKGEFHPAVGVLLGDAQPEVRCAGLALVAWVLEPEAALSVLSRHFSDTVPRVRVEAVGRVADLALPAARGTLAAALNDDDFSVRFEAARGMAELKHHAGFEVLVSALGDSDLRYRAAAALAKLGDIAAVEPIKRIFSGWFLPAFEKTQLAGALAALGDAEGVNHLFKRARGHWSMDRALAIEFLGEVKANGAQELLTEILDNAKDTARGAAARALGRLGEPTASRSLLAVLESGEAPDDLRLDAAEGLLMLKVPGTRERVSAVATGLKTSDAVDELTSLLEDYR